MQPPEGAQVDLGKAQVIDRAPKVIKELKFGVMYVVLVLCALVRLGEANCPGPMMTL